MKRELCLPSHLLSLVGETILRDGGKGSAQKEFCTSPSRPHRVDVTLSEKRRDSSPTPDFQKFFSICECTMYNHVSEPARLLKINCRETPNLK